MAIDEQQEQKLRELSGRLNFLSACVLLNGSILPEEMLELQEIAQQMELILEPPEDTETSFVRY